MTATKIVQNYEIGQASSMLNMANELKNFITENNLSTNIQGKQYVNIEGWQYAGAQLGILPVVDELESIGDANELKYRAKVRLLNLHTQESVGGGFAICSNKESGKRNYQEFAIASMAQTRAIGKAYRNMLAWIIRAAGYEPTPAEEMAAVDTAAVDADYTDTGSRKPETVSKENQKPVETGNRSPISERKAAPKPNEKGNATVKQKTELLLLLNNKAITNDEKNRMIEKINTFNYERINKAITEVMKRIEERQVAHA